mgnify:CR=1 FL=1
MPPTLNALLKYPELYQAGIAVAAVPNMRLYDTIYQERYMGLPDDNVEGYRDGSPLHFAHQLKGKLLLVHGTGDDNVHYQGVEALIDRIVALEVPFLDAERHLALFRFEPKRVLPQN